MNDSFDLDYKKHFWLIPAVGLLLTVLFMLHYGYELEGDLLLQIAHGSIVTTGLWLGCMAIVGYLWKKYPWERFPVQHLVWEVVLILSYTLIFSFGLFFVEFQLNLKLHTEDLFFTAIFTVLITFFITTIYEASFFYKQWKYNFSKSVRLEKDNIEAKYETLKNQINPHFLFNSLNSLTSLVEDNKKAVDYIHDLSEFLRYGLKSRDQELILLREEASMLQKYISLQKERFGTNLIIDNRIEEKHFHFSVPPLVVQMIVENCIKHNIISKDKPLTIKIYVDNTFLIVENNLQRKATKYSTGQGILNITERYKYFTVKEVKVMEDKSKFEIRIPLLKVEL